MGSKTLKTAESTFEIQFSIGGFNPPTLGNRLAPNARITNQPRFASTRKRSSLPSTALLHPSEEQKEEIVKKLQKQNIHTCAKCHNADCVKSNSGEVMWVYCEICQCWYHQDCVYSLNLEMTCLSVIGANDFVIMYYSTYYTYRHMY